MTARARVWSRVALPCALLAAVYAGPASAQQGAASPAAAQVETRKDSLGRDTPRGTVLGFLSAVRNGSSEAAALYLDTTLQDRAAADLAHQLSVVLDARLPARLQQLSDRPEGSLVNPLQPDRDVIGVIRTGDNSTLEITVERVNRGEAGRLWLFSRDTLERIPEVYDEIDVVQVDRYLPGVLKTRIFRIRVFEWLTLLIVLPLFYRLLGWLGLVVGRIVATRQGQVRSAPSFTILPGPVRLLVLALATRLLFANIELPLLERQFWSVVGAVFVIVAVVWLLLRLNAYGETYARSHFFHPSNVGEVTAILRFARQVANVLVFLAGGLAMLRVLGIDASAALAGLGIGGIAVALAAQKTLENIVGGISIIFDKAVRVGDFLKIGDQSGVVESVGLRSTRIRTLDRTLLSVPNGQVANASIETLSMRDKFWFHHFIGLRYGTSSIQMRAVVDTVRDLLARQPNVDRESVRVRFFRVGAFSLDVEVFAYIYAEGWVAFLEVQQDLLIQIMEIVEQAGTEIAFPSQTLHVMDGRPPGSAAELLRQEHSAPRAAERA